MVTTRDSLNTTYKGLSTDEKPTGCRNGDIFAELDTSKIWMYDEESHAWLDGAGNSVPDSEDSGGDDWTTFYIGNIAVSAYDDSGMKSGEFTPLTAFPSTGTFKGKINGYEFESEIEEDGHVAKIVIDGNECGVVVYDVDGGYLEISDTIATGDTVTVEFYTKDDSSGGGGSDEWITFYIGNVSLGGMDEFGTRFGTFTAQNPLPAYGLLKGTVNDQEFAESQIDNGTARLVFNEVDRGMVAYDLDDDTGEGYMEINEIISQGNTVSVAFYFKESNIPVID